MHYVVPMYVDDYDDEGIEKYFAVFHLLQPFPCVVVVEDFGDFFLSRYLLKCFGFVKT